jgi:hypothetical protein
MEARGRTMKMGGPGADARGDWAQRRGDLLHGLGLTQVHTVQSAPRASAVVTGTSWSRTKAQWEAGKGCE